MCYTPQDINESCLNAPGGAVRFFHIPQSEVVSFGAVTANMIPTITFATGKKMFEIQFMDETGGFDENDVGTNNQPAFEFIGKMSLKGNSADDRAYVNTLRAGRHVVAMVLNNGQIFLAGTPFKPCYLRKANRKAGLKIEDPNIQELEWYYKSMEGILEYSGTLASLETVGA